jgi:tetratricopeptide (TPR) repeat protein
MARSEVAQSDPAAAPLARIVDPALGRPGIFHLLAVLALAIVCLAAYSNSLRGPFIFDDHRNIRNNEGLHWTDLSWSGVVSAVRQSPSSSRPVANISFALNYYFGKHDVWGYHAVNIVIHLLCSVIVYFLALATLRRVTPTENTRPEPSVAHWIALSAALIFVSHPIQTQAVTYIVQRMTSLCTLFYLAALLLYIYGRETERPARPWAWWAGGLACWLLALGSKQIAATLPLVVLLYEWYFFQDLSTRWVKKNAKYGLLALGLFALAASVYLGDQPWQRFAAVYDQRYFTLSERLLTQLRVVVFYLSLLVYPHPGRLNLTHHFSTSQSLLDPMSTLLSLIGLCALLGLAIGLARRQRLVSFCLLWFFLNLVIESSVIPLEMVFEHRLYLPMVGVALLAARLMYALAAARPGWAIAATASICLLFTLGAYQRNHDWRDALTLWTDAVEKSPKHARAQYNLGTAFHERGQVEKAVIHYSKAVEQKRNYHEAYVNLGNAKRDLGRFRESLAHYQEALVIQPRSAKAHNGLGVILLHLGNVENAAVHFRKAIRLGEELGEELAEAYTNLGIVLGMQGHYEESIAHHEKALRIASGFAEAHLNLGEALRGAGRLDDAVARYQLAVKLKPELAEAHINLAVVLGSLGRYEESISHYREALRHRPDSAKAHINYAWALATCPEAHIRDGRRALEHAKRAKRFLGEEYPWVLVTLAAANAEVGNFKEAVRWQNRAVEIAPEQHKEDLRRLLDLFRSGKPYREQPR